MERLRKYITIFYSTHILDDVQKVSDTVAILKEGELVQMAPFLGKVLPMGIFLNAEPDSLSLTAALILG